MNGIAGGAYRSSLTSSPSFDSCFSAFSEHIPVLHIAGVPSTVQQKSRPLLHHTLGDGRYVSIPQHEVNSSNVHRFDAYTKAAELFTASQAVLTDTQTAAAQIDRILQDCVIWVRRVVFDHSVYQINPLDRHDLYTWPYPLISSMLRFLPSLCRHLSR